MKLKILNILMVCTVLTACQTASEQSKVNQSATLPAEANWRGYRTSKPDCVKLAVELQSIEATGYVPGKPTNKDELNKLFKFLNASEILRLRKDCWSAAPPDQPGIDWRNIQRSGTLVAAGAKIPPGIDKKDKFAVDLYRDMLLRGYTQQEATSLVGSRLWNEMLRIRHWYVDNRNKF